MKFGECSFSSVMGIFFMKVQNSFKNVVKSTEKISRKGEKTKLCNLENFRFRAYSESFLRKSGKMIKIL